MRTQSLPNRASSGHVTNVTSGPTRADIAQLPVAHAQNILPNMNTFGHVTDVTSGHVTNVTSGRSTSNTTLSVPIYY